MSKLFSYDYYHYDVVKCRRNLNFEKMDTAPCTGKNDRFWLLWGIFREYIKQNIITAVLRKANAHSAIKCFQIEYHSITTIFFGPRKNAGNIIIGFSSSVCNYTFTEKFGNLCINNFSFQRREVQGWYKLTHCYFGKLHC